MSEVPSLCDGRYRLVSELGAGGMATVYRAYDSRLQVERAIKVLSPNLARKRSLRTRFEGEASTMALLEHPNIVRVYDVGSDGDRIFIVMELVDGGSLLDRVKKHGPLPPRMAVQTTIDMLDALKVAHSRGVIHRDIKPHNVLLSSDGAIRITDFGIARIQKWDDDDSLTKTGSVMGTWGFMAPEQRVDAKSVDERADIYSVGATLYSILTDRTPVDLFAADMDPKMMAGIGEHVGQVIKHSTRYDRAERFASVDEMSAELRRILPLMSDDPPDTPPLVDGMERLDAIGGGGTGLMARFESIDRPVERAAQAPALATMVPDDDSSEVVMPPPPLPEVETEKLSRLDQADSGLSLQPPVTAPDVTEPPRARFGIEKVGLVVALVAVGFLLWQQVAPEDVVEDPVANDPVVIEDPVIEDPVVGDPVVGDPVVGDPVGGDPVGGDPVGGDPVGGDPVVKDPVVGDPVVKDPVVKDPVVKDPVVKDPVVKDPVVVATKGLVHSPPRSAKAGSSVTLKVKLPSPDYSVTVFYRPKGGTYAQKNLFGEGGSFSGPIPVDERFSEGLEYWIKATPRGGGDAYTFKSGFSPHKVTVK